MFWHEKNFYKLLRCFVRVLSGNKPWLKALHSSITEYHSNSKTNQNQHSSAVTVMFPTIHLTTMNNLEIIKLLTKIMCCIISVYRLDLLNPKYSMDHYYSWVHFLKLMINNLYIVTDHAELYCLFSIMCIPDKHCHRVAPKHTSTQETSSDPTWEAMQIILFCCGKLHFIPQRWT